MAVDGPSIWTLISDWRVCKHHAHARHVRRKSTRRMAWMPPPPPPPQWVHVTRSVRLSVRVRAMQSHRPLNSRPIDKFKSLRRKKTGGSFSAIPFCIIPSGDPAATRHHVQRNFSEQGRPVQGPKFQGASTLGLYSISWLAGPIDRRRRRRRSKIGAEAFSVRRFVLSFFFFKKEDEAP